MGFGQPQPGITICGTTNEYRQLFRCRSSCRGSINGTTAMHEGHRPTTYRLLMLTPYTPLLYKAVGCTNGWRQWWNACIEIVNCNSPERSGGVHVVMFQLGSCPLIFVASSFVRL